MINWTVLGSHLSPKVNFLLFVKHFYSTLSAICMQRCIMQSDSAYWQLYCCLAKPTYPTGCSYRLCLQLWQQYLQKREQFAKHECYNMYQNAWTFQGTCQSPALNWSTHPSVNSTQNGQSDRWTNRLLGSDLYVSACLWRWYKSTFCTDVVIHYTNYTSSLKKSSVWMLVCFWNYGWH